MSSHVVIVGGGVSGLSAAWYLQQQAQHSDLRYTVLERSDRWGGKVYTEQVDGVGGPFVVEGGPDSFLAQKPWALQLARELGLEDRLLGTNDRMRQVYVVNQGEPVPLPDGVLMIVPTRFTPFALSPLISPLGKLRMGLDLFIPPRQQDTDETLADFVRRRLGSEALDKIAEPLMSGIYNAEAERQSLLATFPRFRDLEQQHGSLIRGMLASRRTRNNSSGKNGSTTPNGQNGAAGKPGTAFVSLRNGSAELIDALAAQLTGDLRLNTGVQSIDRADDGSYRLALSGGDSLLADAVVIATPAYVAADVLRALAPLAAAELDAIRYVSTGTISLAFRAADITRPLNGFGLVIPRSEKRPINAITCSSIKFEHRAPEGYALLRVFFGGSRSPESMDLSDDDLRRVVRSELKALMGIEATSIFDRIYRWPRANPQYDVGHLDRVAAIEAALPPGLYVTGSPYRGVGVPDCVYQAQQTAQQVVAGLKQCVTPGPAML